MSLEAAQQGAGLGVQRVAAVGVLLPAAGDRPGIAGTDGREFGVGEGGAALGAGGVRGVVGQQQGVHHRLGPGLTRRVGVVDRAQVADQVNTAPGVQDLVEVLVAGVAVADQDPGERRPDAAGVDGVLAAVPDVHRGQEPGAGHVQVGQRACGAGGGLIGVGDRRGGDQGPHMRQEPGLEQSGGLGTQPGDPPGGHREPQQRVEHPSRAAYRQEMRARQPRRPSLDAGSVLDPARRDGGCASPQSWCRTRRRFVTAPDARSHTGAAGAAGRRTPDGGTPRRPPRPPGRSPHPAHTGGVWVIVSSGSSTRRSVALGAPGCLPCGLPERVRTERLAAGFLVNGESDDGGLPLLAESRPSWACSAATRPSSSRHPRQQSRVLVAHGRDLTSQGRVLRVLGRQQRHDVAVCCFPAGLHDQTVVDHRWRPPPTAADLSLRLNSYRCSPLGHCASSQTLRPTDTSATHLRRRIRRLSSGFADHLVDDLDLDEVVGLAGEDVAQGGEGVHRQPLRRLSDQPENLLARQGDAALGQKGNQVRGLKMPWSAISKRRFHRKPIFLITAGSSQRSPCGSLTPRCTSRLRYSSRTPV